MAGAHVTLMARTASEIEAAAAAYEPRAVRPTGRPAMSPIPRSFQKYVDEAESYDIFLNNAGMNKPQIFGEVTEDAFDAIMGLNLRAAFFAAQSVARRMMEASGVKGSIITMSSQMGHVGGPKRSVYCASKFAMEGMTKAAAIDLAPHGVRINTICPTFIETPMVAGFLANPRIQGFRAVEDQAWPCRAACPTSPALSCSWHRTHRRS